MKSLKPIILVLAGVLIVGVMFAFKAQELKVETLTLTSTQAKIVIIYPDNNMKELIIKGKDQFQETNTVLNSLNNEGWKISGVSTINSPNGLYAQSIFLERTKQ